MLQEIIETGKTVDSAIDSACEKMGCAREDCEFEIIDLPKKTFFGLKQITAKVRVYRELPDPKPAAAPAAQPPAKKEEPARAKPAAQHENAALKPKKEKPAAQPVKQPEARPRALEAAAQRVNLAVFTPEKEALVVNYLNGIVTAIGLSAEYQTVIEDGEISVQITGKNLGAVIGRRGETLDAIQYLVSLVANRGEEDYLRITVDCGGYRRKRKTTLEELAKRLSSQVLKANVSKTLEPMSPFERRVIHSTVSQIEGVSSASVGDEPYRRVVISTPTSQLPKRSARAGAGQKDREGAAVPRRNGGGNDARDRRPRGDRRSSGGGGRGSTARPAPARQEVPAAPKKTPETTGGGLYEKVDL